MLSQIQQEAYDMVTELKRIDIEYKGDDVYDYDDLLIRIPVLSDIEIATSETILFLFEKLQKLKPEERINIPVYQFVEHENTIPHKIILSQKLKSSNTGYSPPPTTPENRPISEK